MNKRFSLEEFKTIYSQVPRLVIEIISVGDSGILLTKRTINPFSQLWHIPGGTLYKDEGVINALARIVKDELGREISYYEFFAYHEYPKSEESYLNDISLLFKVVFKEGDFTLNTESDAIFYFAHNELPKNMYEKHRQLILNEKNLF